MFKRTLSSFLFIMFAAMALWIVGISSGVLGRAAKVITPVPGSVPAIVANNPSSESESPLSESPLPESQTAPITQLANVPKSPPTIPGANKTLALSDLQDVANQNEANHTQPSAAQIQKSLPLTKMPLYFVQNAGQVDKKFKYYEQASTHATYFAPDGVYMMLSKHRAQQTVSAKSPSVANKQLVSEVVKLSPLQANKNPQILAEA